MSFCVYMKTNPPQNFQLRLNNDLFEIDSIMTDILEATTRAECFILKGTSGGCRRYVRQRDGGVSAQRRSGSIGETEAEEARGPVIHERRHNSPFSAAYRNGIRDSGGAGMMGVIPGWTWKSGRGINTLSADVEQSV